MPRYLVNDTAQETGEHEVHDVTCSWAKLIKKSTSLGTHASCRGAVEEARKHYRNVDGCAHCSPACHTR